MNDDTVRITTLPNGLRVVSESMPRLQTASVGVWVDVGARYEPAEVNGVAHLLEHMAFKGTTTRSARAIAEEIERVGGSLNAYTSREHTAYYARILAGDVDLAADLLADILQHSSFDPAELEKERHVVLQEIGQVRDTPDDLVFDLLQEASYPDQPMGRAILGPEEIVASMPREALLDYMARHYGPARLVFSGAGKVEHDRLVDLASRLFGELPAAAGEPAEPARYQGGTRVERRPDLEQVHLCLAVEGVPYHDPDHFALQVLSTALGGGMSSRLFQEARENRGLCYSISTFGSSHADTGLLGVYAGTVAAMALAPPPDGVQAQYVLPITDALLSAWGGGFKSFVAIEGQNEFGVWVGVNNISTTCGGCTQSGVTGAFWYEPEATVTAVPEPASMMLVGTGLLGLVKTARSRRRDRKSV